MSSTAQIEDSLLESLRTIRRLWPSLLLPTSSRAVGAGSSGTDPVTGLDRLVSMRAEVTLLLNGWARVVVEDRGTVHGIPLGTDAEGLCVFLERHAQWFSGHDAASDALDEIQKASSRVRYAALRNRPRMFTVGPCPEVSLVESGYDPALGYDDCEVACAGELSAVLRRDDDLLPSQLACSVSKQHAWPAHTWIALGRRLLVEEVA